MTIYMTIRRLLGRRRLCFAFGTVLTVSIMYICYQALSIRKLGEELSAEYTKRKDFHSNFQSYQKADFPIHRLQMTEKETAIPSAADPFRHNEQVAIPASRIRGVLLEDVKKYMPNPRGNFRCIHSSEEISYMHVNDNYCDCQDGSDEPSTSACHNGRFYCDYQPLSRLSSSKNFILSSRVNDGLCDCCDGSDEWIHVALPEHTRIDGSYELKLGVDQVPCDNRCSKRKSHIEHI